MTLQEARGQIDLIDPQIRDLLMQRMDCSLQVARIKAAAGETAVLRPDREADILRRLAEGVPKDRLDGYLSVARKILLASRTYQYGLIYDLLDGEVFLPLIEGVKVPEECSRVRFRLTVPNRPNAMGMILSTIGDYGCNMDRLALLQEDKEKETVSFELLMIGDLNETRIRKLLFQLSRETEDFHILEAW